jgi:hypothetical protein
VTHLKSGIAWATDGADVSAAPIEADETVMADGSSVILVALGGCDPVSVAAWFAERFAGLSSETLYARLWVLLEQLRQSEDGAAVAGGHTGDQSLAAFTPDGVLVGTARWSCGAAGSSAELVVAVSPSWHRRGILPVLLERLSVSARAAGVERLTARCTADDSHLMSGGARVGRITVTPGSGGVAELCVELG